MKTSTTGKQRLFRRWLLMLGLLLSVIYLQRPFLKQGGQSSLELAGPRQASQYTPSIAWRTSLNEALARAAQSDKPILIDFTASWCPPCQVMKREVWPSPEVVSLVEKGFVPVLLDIDLPENQAVAQKYGVTSIPSIIVVDARGQVLRQAGFMTASEIRAFLDERDA